MSRASRTARAALPVLATLWLGVILWDIRLPRVLLAGLVGASLALAGALLQGVFGNPLAGPDPLPLFAFAGGLATVLLVYRLAQVDGRALPETLLLAGLACGAALSAATSLLLAAHPDRAGAALLGVDVEAARRWLLVASSLLTAAAVAVSGTIGFVGLVTPHALRRLAGPDHRVLRPAAALRGATLLTVADTAARSLLAPAQLPVGTVTALLGGPFFLVALRRRKSRLLWEGGQP